ncbi:MAG: ribonuclease R [Alphaproteobacteria bacterium]
MKNTNLTKQALLDFIKSSAKPVTKRELAGAFNVKGGEPRIILKKFLKELIKDGIVAKLPGGNYALPDGLPEVAVLEIAEISLDGDVFARPVEWNEALQGKPPVIEIRPAGKGHPAAAPGQRVMAQMTRISPDEYDARIIRKLDVETNRVIGVVKSLKNGFILQPADKKARFDFDIPQNGLKGAKDGDLAVAEVQPGRGIRNKNVQILEVLGRRDDVKAISLISLNEAGLSETFPHAVIAETKDMKVPLLENRTDFGDMPLVTIDGLDARDFDDAVHAEKTDNGFCLTVAIADVSYYVRPYTPLDKEAQKRGNSTYFPDRVVPMLPEALSNDLCSLRPHEPRACLAVQMWIDAGGQMTKYKFHRGLMRSAARLTYEQVQAAQDGLTDDVTGPLLEPVIKPLYEAYKILDEARCKRGALDLDLPERKIVLDEKGRMTGVTKRERLDSHKLIEEFMVLANVAAAKGLEDKKAPCVYRAHDKPSAEKLDNVREFIESFGISVAKEQIAKPAQINNILKQAAGLPYSHLISQVILRTQSQAHYSPDNIGHFGLALQRYAHFTSPIRRYADLLVHRSLVTAYGFGEGGIDDGEVAQLGEICMHISATERVSMDAERSAVDRFTSAFLSSHIGAEFEGRISGVTRFGLFVELTESGADGLVPMRSLPNDFYHHDERAHALIGQRSRRIFRLGAPVTVRLREADAMTGSTLLELVGGERGAEIPGMTFKSTGRTHGKSRSGPHEKQGKPGGFKGKPGARHKGKKRR